MWHYSYNPTVCVLSGIPNLQSDHHTWFYRNTLIHLLTKFCSDNDIMKDRNCIMYNNKVIHNTIYLIDDIVKCSSWTVGVTLPVAKLFCMSTNFEFLECENVHFTDPLTH